MQKKYQELTFKDNFIFTTVMRNPRLSKKLLEMLFGVSIEKIEVSNESTIVYHPEHRGVRLDIYIKDDKNTRYNIEMQTVKKDSILKRSIYLSTLGKNPEDVPKPLVNFLKYVHAKLEESEMDFGDEFVKEIQESVAQIKQSREMGELYMTLQDLLDDEYEEGKMAGIEEGQRLLLISMIRKKLDKGKTIEEIADSLEMDDVVISELIEEINNN